MSRKQPNFSVQRFYAHDHRFADDQHIRHVSFQHNQGRIGKNKNKFKIRDRMGFNDDADMDDRRAGGGRGGMNFQGTRRGRGSPHDVVKMRVRGPGIAVATLRKSQWYQVLIMNGSRYSRAETLGKLEAFLAPQRFYPICYQIQRTDSIFYVEMWRTAQMLLGCTRKVTMDDGTPMVIKIKETRPPVIAVDEVMIARMKVAMGKRYIAENKALDLSFFVRDPEFIDGLYCHLNRPPVLSAVLKIVQENIPDLVALNLTGNALREFENAAQQLAKLKSLRILHLGENSIASLNQLNCFKGIEISELVLERNPVTSQFADRAHFVSEVRKRFPKLTKLDNTSLMPLVTFDVGDEGTLPSPQAAYVSVPEGRVFVKEFLSQYYRIYDSDNRLELAQAYAENAVFSMSAGYPPYTATLGPRLNVYFSESRNLLRVLEFPRRKVRLHTGRANIVDFLFKHLPKSQHDLLSFAVDLPFFTPELISLSVTGVFRETGVGSPEVWPLRHFSRTFLIVPMGGGFCIVNETLFVTNATDDQAEVAFKSQPSVGAASPTSPQPTPSSPVAPIGSPAASAAPGVVPDEIVKLRMVHTVAQETGMNLDWSTKCLEETGWDFQRAAWTFTELQKRGAIPPEAFVN